MAFRAQDLLIHVSDEGTLVTEYGSTGCTLSKCKPWVTGLVGYKVVPDREASDPEYAELEVRLRDHLASQTDHEGLPDSREALDVIEAQLSKALAEVQEKKARLG